MPDDITPPADGAPPAPAPGTPPAPPKEQLDRESYASLQQDIGKKAVLKEIKEKYGVESIEALEALIKKPAKPETDPAITSKLTEAELENKRLRAENEETVYTQRIKDALMPLAPKEVFINSMVRDFKADYELRSHKGIDYVFKKGTDTVELVGGQMATLSMFFTERAKNADFASQFKVAPPTTAGHVTPGIAGAGAALSGEIIVTDAQAKDKNFMAAVKASGQEGKYISSGKVDYDKVAPHLAAPAKK